MVKPIYRLAAFMIIGAALVACAPQPKKTDDVVVRRGPEPTTEEAERAIRYALSRMLKDPGSVTQFAILGTPRPITWYQGLLAGNHYEEGWMVCFEYNAKNSYGGYVGVKTERMAIRGGVVVNANWALINAGC